jgi:hypothetical protein
MDRNSIVEFLKGMKYITTELTQHYFYLFVHLQEDLRMVYKETK